MIRTQVYLTDKQRAELLTISKTLGKKQSELIREAVDYYIDYISNDRKKAVLQEAAGLWKNRDDLPNFDDMRKDLQRDFSFDNLY